MEKINGIIISGKGCVVANSGKTSPCIQCALLDECEELESEHHVVDFCMKFLGGDHFRYSQELTDKINDTPQPTKLATVRATGKAIEVTECTDHNSGTVYFLDVNDDDAGPYDYKELDFENT